MLAYIVHSADILAAMLDAEPLGQVIDADAYKATMTALGLSADVVAGLTEELAQQLGDAEHFLALDA